MSPHLVLQFLGLPQVLLTDRPVSTDRRKAIALLAYLSVNDIGRPRQKYSREVLSALLWPDYDQAKAFSNLRTILWELRRALGDGWLVAEREEIHLNETTEIDLDVAQFLRLLSQGGQHAQHDPTLRIPLLTDAVKLYRDHFLAGFSLKDAPNFNEWAFAESEDLRRKLADALTLLSDDHCGLRQADQAIPYARRLVALDQLNESSHRQLMEVYWQAGQQSAALKQYETCEQILRKELNLDPQPETRALYKKILKGEVKPVQVRKQTETVVPKNNLPLQLTNFIGREKEQGEIVHLVKKNRLVSLVGTGGMGKSRLSFQAGSALLNDFPNGTWLVELAPLSDSALIPQAIVNTLGLLEQAERSSQDILTDFLQNKQVLLILDNCEHIIQACAQLAEALLRVCPDLHILATSREALGIPGEALYSVPSLTMPDPLHTTLETLPQYEAAQLFIDRAQSAFAGFRPTAENLTAIVQLCSQLDGIPLAIELAAARLRLLGVEEIAERLAEHDRFRLLTGGARTALPRHRTLQALIDWSHDLLSEPERVLLRRLSIFAGEWTLDAAEYLTSDRGSETLPNTQTDLQSPFDVLDLLTSLVNKSLITVDSKPGQETRYGMLETIRQYAREKLWQAGEGELLRRRHLAYYVDLAERAEQNLRATAMILWLDRIEAEHENIRSALEWGLEGDIEAELRLASALLWFWHIRGYKNEGVEWLERALSIEAIDHEGQSRTPDRARVRGKALNASGSLMVMNLEFGRASGRLEESLALHKELGPSGKQGMAYALLRSASLPSARDRAKGMLGESLAWFREIGDKFGAAETLLQLSGLVQIDDHKQAVLLIEEHLALSREIGDQDGIAAGLSGLADLAVSKDDYGRAARLYEESLAAFRTVKNSGALSMTFGSFGDLFFLQGDYERATKTYEEALAFAQELGYRFHIAFYFYSLGILAWYRGEYSHAMHQVSSGQSIFRNIGNQWLAISSLHTLGDIALAEGDEELSARWYQDELAFSREVGLEPTYIFALVGLGDVAWAKGEYDLAFEQYQESLRMSREADIKQAIFHSLCGLGRVAQSRGDYGQAREFFLEALILQERRVSPLFKWIWLKTYSTTISYPLEALAILASTQNQMERAARLIGAAETLYTPLRFEISAKARAEHNQAIAAAQAALGEDSFAKAWAEGQAMTLEEAVAYALEE